MVDLGRIFWGTVEHEIIQVDFNALPVKQQKKKKLKKSLIFFKFKRQKSDLEPGYSDCWTKPSFKDFLSKAYYDCNFLYLNFDFSAF